MLKYALLLKLVIHLHLVRINDYILEYLMSLTLIIARLLFLNITFIKSQLPCMISWCSGCHQIKEVFICRFKLADSNISE